MKKVSKRFFTLLTSFAVSASALAAFPVNAVRDSVFDAAAVQEHDDSRIHITDGKGTAFCTVYKPDAEGSTVLDADKTYRSFDCSWTDTKRVDFCVGETHSFKLEEQKMYYLKYTAEINCKDSYGFGAIFNCYEENDAFLMSQKTSALTEVRILESYSGLSDMAEDNIAGYVTVGGVAYKLYRSHEVINDIEADVLIIARSESLPAGSVISGTIDVKAFADALEKQGIILTSTKDLQTIVHTEGNSGSANVLSSELISIPYPDEVSVPNYDKSGKTVYREGTTYEFWEDESVSYGEMTVKSDGTAICTYDNYEDNSDCFYQKGIIKENGVKFDNVIVDYEGYFHADSRNNIYAVGVNYDLGNPDNHFVIVQFRKSDSFLDDAELLGTAVLDEDDVEYNFYKKTYPSRYNLDGTPYTEYIAVSSFSYGFATFGLKGNVDLNKYNKAWESFGVECGDTLYSVNTFAEAFGYGRGEIDICDVDIDIQKPEDDEDIVLQTGNTSVQKGVYKYYSGGDHGSCTLGSSGAFTGKAFQEHDGEFYSFGKGVEFGSREIDRFNVNGLNVEYKANVSSDGDYCIGVDGKMRGENDELYISYRIIDRASYNPVPENAEYLGEKEINGVIYELYVAHTRNTFGFGRRCVDEYYNVRKDLSGKYENFENTIYVGEHVKAWQDAGLIAGNISSIYLNTDMQGKGDSMIEFERSRITVFQEEPDVEVIEEQEYTADDAEQLKGFILGEDNDIPEDKDYDLNNDGKWDSYDLILLERSMDE